jgi:hypothetical protein
LRGFLSLPSQVSHTCEDSQIHTFETTSDQPTLSSSRARPRWAWVPFALFLVASGALFALVGVPTQRDLVFAWLLGGLACVSVSDLRGFFRGLIRDWLPFLAILLVYDSLRGSAGRLFAPHFLPQLQFDRLLFGGQAPTVTLQRLLWDGHARAWDLASWAIYMTHFFFTPALAAVLWKMNRDRFHWFTRRVVALSFAGLITYALYPAAPPWLASQRHLMAPITRIIPQVWASLPVAGDGSVTAGYRLADSVAAVPSLHAAFSSLVAATVWPFTPRWARPLVIAYPLAMAFVIVYTGEHYVADVLLGWLYTGGVLLAFRFGRRARTPRAADLAPVAHSARDELRV